MLVIDSVDDWDARPWFSPMPELHSILYVDFERMLVDGVDAIFLTEHGQWETRWSNPRHLYGWDVESLLVMNPDIVHVVELDA